MAAGLGTRLRPFTWIEPKAFLPVLGVPCTQFALDAAVEAGVREIVSNIHHLPARAREGLRSLDLGGAKLSISDESGQLLGSGGGLAKALPCFGGEPFFLLNADVLCDVDLRQLAAHHAKLRKQYGVKLTLTVFERPSGLGSYREILMDSNSELIRGLGEVKRGSPYFVGAAVIEPEALAGLSADEPSEFVPKILEPAIREKRAGLFLTQGQWFDVGSPQLWAETHFSLMELLESAQISTQWRKRIETKSRKLRKGIWADLETAAEVSTLDWQAPAYFGGGTELTVPLGPRAVIYGVTPSTSSTLRLCDFISYGGVFSSFPRE